MFRVGRVPITFVPLVASCGVYCFGALVSFLSGQALFHNFDDLKLWRRWMAVMLLENTFVVHDEEFHLFKVSGFFWFPISYTFAKDAKWATWSRSGEICGTFDGGSRGDSELPLWCLKDNECECL